jgi:hypothetical protein
MLRYCRECQKVQQVTHFDHDDPVLACGHIKKLNGKSSECARHIQDVCRSVAKETGAKSSQLEMTFFLDVLRSLHMPVDYCPICDAIVSVVEDEDGQLVCAGNLFDNPGCGCVLIKSIKQRLLAS